MIQPKLELHWTAMAKDGLEQRHPTISLIVVIGPNADISGADSSIFSLSSSSLSSSSVARQLCRKASDWATGLAECPFEVVEITDAGPAASLVAQVTVTRYTEPNVGQKLGGAIREFAPLGRLGGPMPQRQVRLDLRVTDAGGTILAEGHTDQRGEAHYVGGHGDLESLGDIAAASVGQALVEMELLGWSHGRLRAAIRANARSLRGCGAVLLVPSLASALIGVLALAKGEWPVTLVTLPLAALIGYFAIKMFRDEPQSAGPPYVNIVASRWTPEK